ncbi:MAG: GGDEF domain-containing protein, partial [Betaproteobacteria bacterium]
LALTRAEALTLLFEIDAAERQLSMAQEIFSAHCDDRGVGDCCLTSASIGLAAGDSVRYQRAYAKAVEHYRLSGDATRLRIALAWCAYIGAYSDPAPSLHVLAQTGTTFDDPPSLSAVLCAAEASAKFWRDPPRSIVMALRARDFADQTGMVRLAIMASSNAGWALECLGDLDAAMECIEWSVNRARETGWPTILAAANVRYGSVLRELGELDRSHEVLTEAVAQYASLSGGMHKAIALAALAHTLLAKNMPEEAVTAYETSTRICREVNSNDNLVEGVINLARAQSAAGRPEKALAAIAEAQALIDQFGFAERSVALSQALAEIHAAHPLANPPGMQAENAPLHYMERALEIGRGIEGWQPTPKLLMGLADASAAAGNTERAFEYAKEVIRAEQSDALKKAAHRSVLMQGQKETAQAQAEAAQQRTLAAAMTQQSQTLKKLGRIGREITSNLDHVGVFTALMQHLSELADVQHLSIWLLDKDGKNIAMSQGAESGVAMTAASIPLESPGSPIATCIREQTEIFQPSADATHEGQHATAPASTPWQSGYFGPLAVKDRVLGAICFQSTAPQAYGERELLIFRTLCSYVAIALDNTLAYEHLQEARTQLEEASLTDTLTGMRNRRYLMLHADVDAALCVRQHERAQHTGTPANDADLIFLMLDIDHFKRVNDIHGHAAGDAVLSQIRVRLEKVFRKSDHLVRWGGEEFLIVARATSRDRAERLATRVCEVLRDEPFALPDDKPLMITCSVGFACFPFLPLDPHIASWQDVVDLADIALYAAKRSGRNSWVGAVVGEAALEDIHDVKQDAAAAMRRGAVRFCGQSSEEAILRALENG